MTVSSSEVLLTHTKLREGVVSTLSINRPTAANSFNQNVIRQITQLASEAGKNPDCRLLILTGQGKHFSAGADLAWMKDAAKLDHDGNLRDARELARMFEVMSSLPMPTLAAVRGSIYGGAVGLCAAVDFCIASKKSKFCLSEVKLGLIPAVILPYLGQKIRLGDLNRLAFSAQVFTAEDAKDIGLVSRVVEDETFIDSIRDEVNALLACDPLAQRDLKQLSAALRRRGFTPGDDTAEAIAHRRVAQSAKLGLQAFFEKKQAPWHDTLDSGWTL